MTSTVRACAGPVAVVVLLGGLEIALPGKGLIVCTAAVLLVPLTLAPRVAVTLLALFLCLQDLLVHNLATADRTLGSMLKAVDEIAMLAGALYVAVRSLNGERFWFRLRDWRWALVFLAAGVISSALHGEGNLPPALLGFALSCKFFCFILFGSAIPWQRGDGDRFLTGVLVATLVIFLVGVWGFTEPNFVVRHVIDPDLVDQNKRGGVMPAMVPFVHPAAFGWAMAVGVLAATTRLFQKRQRGLAVVVLGAGLAGVLLSMRRRPLLGILVAVFMTLLQLERGRRGRALVVTLIVIGGAVGFGSRFLSATLDDTLSAYGGAEMAEKSARFLLVGVAVELAGLYLPFGCGFGRFGTYPSTIYYSSVYSQMGISKVWGFSEDRPMYVMDSYWPHILGEAGIIGILAMALFFRSLWSQLRQHQSPVHRFACLILIEGLVESLAGPVFDQPLQIFMIGIPIGMALRFGRQSEAGMGAA